MDNALTQFRILRYPQQRAEIKFLRRRKGVNVVDEIKGQIHEFYKLENPAATDDRELYKAFQKQYVASRQLDAVGVWVWYPWNKKLVHLLPPRDVQRLRVSRNRYLITDSEQAKFYHASVAIAGLSIGSSIANTLRLQGGAQTLKLADFDTLELSNTNRISVGVTHLGEQKIDIIKEKLLETDPFTKLSLFPKGLSPETVERFCKGADVIFDEVDNLLIKVLLRQAARKFRIPLIMLTDNDDGVLIDYYPYHKNLRAPLFYGVPDRKILGAVSAKTPPTKAQMVKLSSQVVGPDHISERMIKSLRAVGKSLVSWPQLGTAALFSGVVGAYMTRMIVNGHHFGFRRRLIRLNDQIV